MNKTEKTFSLNETREFVNFPGGEKEFITWLHAKNYLISNDKPSQNYKKMEWFCINYSIKKVGGKKVITHETRVRIIGLYGLKRRIKREFPICKVCAKRDIRNELGIN